MKRTVELGIKLAPSVKAIDEIYRGMNSLLEQGHTINSITFNLTNTEGNKGTLTICLKDLRLDIKPCCSTTVCNCNKDQG